MIQAVKERYHHFLVTNFKPIPEIKCTLVELVHEPTGAQIMQLANEDEENLFNLSFRTYPETSNGVAHILEHTVLCGSERFPIHDPFFSMNRRSLNTFMNAMTGSDFTCYPASSQVPQDFYNLLEVYLDAVFKPKLSKQSFLQEGHRLEFLKSDDPNSPLLFKGIVYNEMKGAMSSPDARLGQTLMHALYPDLTYSHNSGGDPKEIPNLTFEELKAFHAKYYHPSRCLFFFYGNLPLERHLDFLETHAFKDVQKVPPLPHLPKQKRFPEKKSQTHYYPITEEEDTEEKTLVGMSWLTCSILDQEELLALDVLDVVLTGTDAAPLKKALLKSNLCKQTDSIIDNEMSEIPFSVFCKGCKEGSAPEIEKIVRSTLAELAKEGIPPQLVEAAIHQIEMSRMEITGNSSPFGLSLFWRSALLKQHGGNPEDGLKIHTLFHSLNSHLKDPKYFAQLIEKYFLNNPHFILIEMRPDKKLAAKEIDAEKEKLTSICKQLKDRDVQKLIVQAKELAQYQENTQHENVDLLPKVTLDDVPKQGKEFSLTSEKRKTFTLYHHPCFTNGLTYVDLIFDLPHIERKYLPFVRLFSLFLPQVGCGGRNYQEHLEYLLEHTGGAKVSLDLGLQADDPNHMRPSLSIRSKALDRKLDKLFPLFKDMLTSADFTDQERIQELLMQHVHGLENSIHHHSLRYAVNLAARGLSTASTIVSEWYGLDYFWSVKKIADEFERSPQKLIDSLQQLQQTLLGLEGADLVVSCDTKSIETLKKEKFYGLEELSLHQAAKWQGNYDMIETCSQARIIASPVAFTALLFSSVSYTHPYAAALSIASEIMENKTLHSKIREQGGAYGSGAVNGVLSGQFYFYSYRDPHLKSTLAAFHDAAQELVNGGFNESEIEEAKLGLFQEMDAPTPPGARGITAYARLRGGRTPQQRQRFREALIQCDREKIIHAAKETLLKGLKNATVVTFAGKELLEKENAQLPIPLPIYPITE